MAYIWLSYVLDEETPLYGGVRGKITIFRNKNLRRGDSCNVTDIGMISHAGTHVDAPQHFFDDGPAIDAYPAGFWIFDNVTLLCLADVRIGQKIDVSDIVVDAIDAKTECLLIKTGFSRFRGKDVYWKDSPYMSSRLARMLRALDSLKIIGIDCLSVSNVNHREEGRCVHNILLSSGDDRKPLLIVEDMDLSKVNKKIKKLFVLPLRIKDGDGAPCGVIAKI